VLRNADEDYLDANTAGCAKTIKSNTKVERNLRFANCLASTMRRSTTDMSAHTEESLPDISKPAASASNARALLRGPGDRSMDDGPLTIVKDIVALASRLAAEHERVVADKNTCCVVICAPDLVSGWRIEDLVRDIAERFAHSLRSYDSIFLYGREKILLCLPHVSAKDARSVLGRLRDMGAEQSVPMPNGTTTLTTVSVGGVMMDRTTQVQEIIDRADRAMELARISGGNKTGMWSPDML
jgi:diguanylate cyclase (GGDEF)-like protein